MCSLHDPHFAQTVQFLEFSKQFVIDTNEKGKTKFYFPLVHIWK